MRRIWNDGQESASDERSIDTLRTEALSDGVFAIAATLLVLNVEVPTLDRSAAGEQLSQALFRLAPDVLSLVLSFLVISSFWMTHKAIFRNIVRVDRTLTWLNSLFLLSIIFLPFTTGLFDTFTTAPLVVTIYAASLALARAFMTGVWWYASGKRRLIHGDITDKHIRFHRIRGVAIPTLFLLSIGLAYVSITLTVIVWICLFIADQILLQVFERSE